MIYKILCCAEMRCIPIEAIWFLLKSRYSMLPDWNLKLREVILLEDTLRVRRFLNLPISEGSSEIWFPLRSRRVRENMVDIDSGSRLIWLPFKISSWSDLANPIFSGRVWLLCICIFIYMFFVQIFVLIKSESERHSFINIKLEANCKEIYDCVYKEHKL